MRGRVGNVMAQSTCPPGQEECTRHQQSAKLLDGGRGGVSQRKLSEPTPPPSAASECFALLLMSRPPLLARRGDGRSRQASAVFLFLCCLVGCSHRAPGSSSASAGNIDSIRSNNLGVAEMSRGRPAQALELFRQAWRGDPSLFAARLNEGIALLNVQRFDEAREVLMDATQRRPDSARAWYNLGILYRNLAQADPAIDAFENVTRIDSADADALYFLGQLHSQA